MGKVFGIISLLLGIASLVIVWFYYALFLYALPIAAIVFGGIGIAKDDSKALGIVGLILGIVSLILYILFPIFILALILGLFMP